MRGFVLVDHGSQRDEANAVVRAMVPLVQTRLGAEWVVTFAHLERDPRIAAAVAECAAAGVSELVVVPFMLAPGRHAAVDVPREARAAAAAHGLACRVAAPLGADALLAELVVARAASAG